LAQPGRKLKHLLHLGVGSDPGNLIHNPVALLPDSVQYRNQNGMGCDGVSERCDRSFVGSLSLGPVALRRECESSELQSGLVGKPQPAVGAQSFNCGVGEVSFDDPEEACDLLPARRVRDDPAGGFPVAQAHRALQPT
jgi:hypothetical protein